MKKCESYEVLFSKDNATLSFALKDLPLASRPEGVSGVVWSDTGWLVEFVCSGEKVQVAFAGAPEEVMAKVADQDKMLIVGLHQDPGQEPQISLSEELALPGRAG